MTSSAELPYPPFALANRVLSLEGASDPEQAYELLGAGTKAAIVDLLAGDWSFDGKRMLDFGCGAGRTLRHFVEEAERGEFWGVDIDEPSIDWLTEHLSPPLHVLRADVDPPLPFDDQSFDLAWAISVFTHLPENSLAWMLELHRLLRPGAFLVASFTGRWSSELLAGESWDEDRIGMIVANADNHWDLGGPSTLMSEWWVRAHWGPAFDFVTVLPEMHHQSWALLRRRDVELTLKDLEAPSDDPREAVALQHQLAWAQRQHRAALEAERAAAAAQRAYYEESLSWRITRPLRAARERLRSR